MGEEGVEEESGCDIGHVSCTSHHKEAEADSLDNIDRHSHLVVDRNRSSGHGLDHHESGHLVHDVDIRYYEVDHVHCGGKNYHYAEDRGWEDDDYWDEEDHDSYYGTLDRGGKSHDKKGVVPFGRGVYFHKEKDYDVLKVHDSRQREVEEGQS